MGVSTDAILCYGIQVEDEIPLPWDDFDDFEDWWLDVTGFEPSDDYLAIDWDTYSSWHRDETHPYRIATNENFESKNAWLKEHPCPIELVRHCSDRYPMYILAIPGTVRQAVRGFPNKASTRFADLRWGRENPNNVLLAFAEKHDIETVGEPAWWLCSFWGE